MRKKFACLSLAIVLCMSLVAVMAISFNGFHVNAEETKEEKQRGLQPEIGLLIIEFYMI